MCIRDSFQDAVDVTAGRAQPRIDGLSVQAMHNMNRLWNDAIEQTRLFLKYQIALTCNNKPLLNTGTEPYQSADLLKKLRDRLMHFKPEWQTGQPHAVERQLRSKLPENLQVTTGKWYPNRALGAGCAQWACLSAQKFVEHWWVLMGFTNPPKTELTDWPISWTQP